MTFHSEFTWEIIIALSFSFSAILYALLFKNKRKSIIMQMGLLLPFLLFPITETALYSSVNQSMALPLAFFFFFLFITFTYQEINEKNKEFYYFFMIMYGLTVSAGMYSYITYPVFFQDNNNLLSYATITIGLLVILIHLLKKIKSNKILLSYIAGGLFLILKIFPGNLLYSYGRLFLLAAFFILMISHFRDQLYTPLLTKIDKMQKQLDKRELDMPEHIRQKFQILENNKAKLMDMAHKDKMTGVMNKGKLLTAIKELIDNPRVTMFSVLMFDIDNFKRLNDNSGHLVGDECIIELARIGENSIRKHDFIARYGGDEFIIVLQGIDAGKARVIAERFRRNVEEKTNPTFSISIGVSSYPEDGKTVKHLIESADQSLYLSKERGKNKVSHISRY